RSVIHTPVFIRRGIPNLLLLDVTSPCVTAHENGRPAKRRQTDQSGRARVLMFAREPPEEYTHGPIAANPCSSLVETPSPTHREREGRRASADDRFRPGGRVHRDRAARPTVCAARRAQTPTPARTA